MWDITNTLLFIYLFIYSENVLNVMKKDQSFIFLKHEYMFNLSDID